MNRTSRLIDLHVDWPLQYCAESTLFRPEHYPNPRSWISQADGYLGAARAAFVACFRTADDWASRPDPWRALSDLISRVEAEFSGRLLIDQADIKRWDQEPDDALTWALIGVEGFDALIRESADLARLSGLFERGVRLFQPVYGPGSILAGSGTPGDDRGLSALGIAFLEAVFELATGDGPRPIVDLAHLNPRSASAVLDWFEADPRRYARIAVVYSHGALEHDGFSIPRAITRENLARLRAIGGYVGFSVGPPFYETTAALKAGIEQAASMPWNRGKPSLDGIAIGSDFLGVDQTLPGLGNAEGVIQWLKSTFDQPSAEKLIWRNADDLIRRTIGVME